MGRLRTALAATAVVSCALALAGAEPAGAAITGSMTSPAGTRYDYDIACSTRTFTVIVRPKDKTVKLAFELRSYTGGAFSGASILSMQSFDSLQTSYAANDADAYAIAEGPDGEAVEFAPHVDLGACTTPSTDDAGTFTVVSPTRVLDTRPGSPVNSSGSKPEAGAEVRVTLGGAFGVPADATAVALNVTATEATAPGYVQALPTGRAALGAFSNVNVARVGQTVPNFAIVPLGDGGQISLYTQSGTHLVADLLGYVVPAGGAVRAGRFVGVTPARALDTRPDTRAGYSGDKPAAGSLVRVPVGAVAGAPPADQIGAVVLNVTATEATSPGYVQAAAAGALTPGASSNLNIESAGQTVPNLVIVPVADGAVDLYTQSGTHLVADVLGFFTSSAAPSSSSGLFVTLPPERIRDTRGTEAGPGLDTRGVAAGVRGILPGFFGLPDSLGSAMLNVTVTNPAGPGYLQLAPGGGLVPGASSNVNYTAGQTVANAAIVATGDRLPPPNGGLPEPKLDIDLYSSASTDLVVDLFGFFTA